MTRIYITRHGQTLWNQEGRFQGQKNSPLSREGIASAKMLYEIIKNHPFEAVYVSPLGRTIETADILMPTKNYTIEPLLKEMDFGVIEGMPKSEVIEKYGDLHESLWHNPAQFNGFPNGESFEEVFDRVETCLKQIIKKHPQGDVFIVTHGMYIACLLAYVQRYSKEDLTKTNDIVPGCSLTLVTYIDHQWHIEFKGQKNGCLTSM